MPTTPCQQGDGCRHTREVSRPWPEKKGVKTMLSRGLLDKVAPSSSMIYIDVCIFLYAYFVYFSYLGICTLQLYTWVEHWLLAYLFFVLFLTQVASPIPCLACTNLAYRADCVSDEAEVLSYNSRQDAAASYTHTAALSLPLRRSTPLWSDTWSGRCVFARDYVRLWYFLPQLWIMSPQCCCEFLRDASSTLWLKTFRCVCVYIFYSLWFPIGIVAIARGRYIRKQYIYAWSQQE